MLFKVGWVDTGCIVIRDYGPQSCPRSDLEVQALASGGGGFSFEIESRDVASHDTTEYFLVVEPQIR